MQLNKRVTVSVALERFLARAPHKKAAITIIINTLVRSERGAAIQVVEQTEDSCVLLWKDALGEEETRVFIRNKLIEQFGSLCQPCWHIRVESEPENAGDDKAALLREIEAVAAGGGKKGNGPEDEEELEESFPDMSEIFDADPVDDTPQTPRLAPEAPEVSAQPENAEKPSFLDALRAFDRGEFLSMAEEALQMAPIIRSNNTEKVFLNRNYLFSINDDESFREYLKMFYLLVEEMGIAKAPRIHYCKFCMPGSNHHRDPLDDVRRAVIRQGRTDGVQLLAIDISEWMSKTGDTAFREMLTLLERNRDSGIFFFRIPFVEREVFLNILSNIEDVLTVHPICIPPLSMDELLARSEKELGLYNYTMNAEARNVLAARYIQEKSDGRFYGIATVRKVVQEALYIKMLHDARHGVNDREVKGSEILSLCGNAQEDVRSGMEMLDDFVGIEAIRDRMLEIIAQIEMSIKNPDLGAPCIHMRFVGSPGTGKTTVARVIGKILCEKGVLRNGNFFEHTGREFCGRFVGETAPKTASMCRDAYGSVLFIDEAYSLYSNGHIDSNDFGKEALDTLITEMENHRNDLLVIMAGYPDEMQTLMGGNSGLESRMPYLIEFPNYTREQLAEIFMRMTDKHFDYADDLQEAVRDYFMALPEELVTSKNFSNARFVRNLFERTWGKAVLRSQLDRVDDIILTREDFEAASADHEFKNPDAKKPRVLGFT